MTSRPSSSALVQVGCVALLAIVPGCSLPGALTFGLLGGGSGDPFPLASGDVWTYKTSAVVGNATVTGNGTVKVDTYSKTGDTAQATVIKNFTFNIPNVPAFDQTNVRSTVIKTSSSLTFGSGTTNEVIPLPFKAGGTWTGAQGQTATFSNEDLTIAAGTFKNAFKATYSPVTTNGVSITETDWYATGVGLLKSQLTAPTSSGTLVLSFELSTYTVN